MHTVGVKSVSYESTILLADVEWLEVEKVPVKCLPGLKSSRRLWILQAPGVVGLGTSEQYHDHKTDASLSQEAGQVPGTSY